MSDLFDVDGANLDRGFENLKAAEHPIRAAASRHAAGDVGALRALCRS
jgi:hypothetical protein